MGAPLNIWHRVKPHQKLGEHRNRPHLSLGSTSRAQKLNLSLVLSFNLPVSLLSCGRIFLSVPTRVYVRASTCFFLCASFPPAALQPQSSCLTPARAPMPSLDPGPPDPGPFLAGIGGRWGRGWVLSLPLVSWDATALFLTLHPHLKAPPSPWLYLSGHKKCSFTAPLSRNHKVFRPMRPFIFRSMEASLPQPWEVGLPPELGGPAENPGSVTSSLCDLHRLVSPSGSEFLHV